jgi:hypothetical protein
MGITVDTVQLRFVFKIPIMSSNQNKKRNRLLAQTMELATKITEWFPNAKYVRTEGGRHHPYPFDVFETIAEGREIEFKVAMKHSGPKAYIMRIKK